ncbi:hypothetical protein [Pseudomonas sp. ICMP 460]|uniref:hypothetical protein n=1 Tax=Pseudomonas sp. ICMP 460 TaxID=1718917 RepID=UPI002114C55F|nr:hypothetical protein [Pseudomonas sp. ICMP 460]
MRRHFDQDDFLINDLDGPRTAQQELFYDLEDAAAVIGWSVVELTAMAAIGKTPDETATLMKVCALLAAQQEKLGVYAGEAKAQRIRRSDVGD